MQQFSEAPEGIKEVDWAFWAAAATAAAAAAETETEPLDREERLIHSASIRVLKELSNSSASASSGAVRRIPGWQRPGASFGQHRRYSREFVEERLTRLALMRVREQLGNSSVTQS